jgi:hypothetical protein
MASALNASPCHARAGGHPETTVGAVEPPPRQILMAVYVHRIIRSSRMVTLNDAIAG